MSDWRLMGVRNNVLKSHIGAIFQNQASDATFQNLPPVFCDHASYVYDEWQSVDHKYQTNRALQGEFRDSGFKFHTDQVGILGSYIT